MQRARGKADYCEMVVMEKMLQASGSGLAHSARLINYDPENPDKLREFDNFDAAFAFDEECRLNGTGGRKAVHLPKPKDTVPKDQLALEKAMKHAVEEDGNKTRVHLENVEENIHGRHDQHDRKMDELHDDVQDMQNTLRGKETGPQEGQSDKERLKQIRMQK